MPEFVLDASVAISWCFPGDPTEDTPYSRKVLRDLITWNAIVPEIWAFEIANNIFVSHSKRKRIDERQVVDMTLPAYEFLHEDIQADFQATSN